MAGLKLLTTLDAPMCLKLAWRAAQDHGFSLPPLEECAKRFSATKGNSLISMIAGPFATTPCNFQISIEQYGSTNEVVLEKNSPWLTSGAAGVAKVNRQAEDLMNAIACAIEKAGGAIQERKEF